MQHRFSVTNYTYTIALNTDTAALHLSKLSNLLSKASRGRFGKKDAEFLKSFAKSSVGVKNTYISIQITQTITQIELIESQINELETVIEAAMNELDSVIMTVPGIGKLNGAMIISEIGDIKRFYHSSRHKCYTFIVSHFRYKSKIFDIKLT